MQMTFLPKRVCDEIDKACRNFIWGDGREGEKVHLVAWDKICSPKFKGGLGLRKSRHVNMAFMLLANWVLCDQNPPLVNHYSKKIWIWI